MRALAILLIIIISIAGISLYTIDSSAMTKGGDLMNTKPDNYPIATFGGGCFWCVESEFRTLEGVLFTRAGYIGGNLPDPSYQDITTGKTGHAEAVEITFNPQKVTYSELVDFFLTKAHDPTQINRQGVDVGTQYRSEIFYHNDEQRKIAKETIKHIDESKLYSKPIATKVSVTETFWEAEDYHQQYYEKYQEKTGKQHIRVLLKKGKL